MTAELEQTGPASPPEPPEPPDEIEIPRTSAFGAAAQLLAAILVVASVIAVLLGLLVVGRWVLF